MKRNFLKTSLSTFAFTLAIAASFAFSPVLNEDGPVNGYIQILEPLSCDRVTHNCIIGLENNCTIIIGGGQIPVYGTRNPAGTICSNQLTKPQP